MGTELVKEPKIDPRYASFKVAIRKSKIHRYGVYAEEFIPANRKVMEYTGERVNRKEAKRRGEGEYTYLFALDSYWTLDGAVGGSGAEIMNHCCEPNLISRIMKGHILYMSLRDIQPGEELTIDYNFGTNVERTLCICGAPTCRGTIQKYKRPPKDLVAAKTAATGANAKPEPKKPGSKNTEAKKTELKKADVKKTGAKPLAKKTKSVAPVKAGHDKAGHAKARHANITK
jgi:hypothetical protein